MSSALSTCDVGPKHRHHDSLPCHDELSMIVARVDSGAVMGHGHASGHANLLRVGRGDEGPGGTPQTCASNTMHCQLPIAALQHGAAASS